MKEARAIRWKDGRLYAGQFSIQIPDGVYVDGGDFSEDVPALSESLRLWDAERSFVIEIGEDFFRGSPEASISEYIQSFRVPAEAILSRVTVRRAGLEGGSLVFRESSGEETLLEYLSCGGKGGQGISISLKAKKPKELAAILKIPDVKIIMDSLEIESHIRDNK